MIGAPQNPGGMAYAMTMAPKGAGPVAPQMMAPQPAAGITPIISFAPGTPEAYQQEVYDRWRRTGSLAPQGSPYGQQQDPYADIRDLMEQYPGVDPNELRRFKEMQRQAQLADAADRFRQDQAAVAPPYERARQEQNQAMAEQFAQKNQQQYGYRPMGSPGGSTYKPGMAQPIQPQSQGTPYGSTGASAQPSQATAAQSGQAGGGKVMPMPTVGTPYGQKPGTAAHSQYYGQRKLF